MWPTNFAAPSLVVSWDLTPLLDEPMTASSAAPTTPREIWAVAYVRPDGADTSRLDLVPGRAAGEQMVERCAQFKTARLRLARFVEVPMWRDADDPPATRVPSPGYPSGESDPVLVVAELPDGSRVQTVARYYVDVEDPEDRRWRTNCAAWHEIDEVRAWRPLDWPAT